MRDSSEFDEINEDVSDRLFTLDEIMSESEVEEVETGEATMSEEERDELLREVHDSIRVVSPKTGEEIDPEEFCRLYLEEGMSLRKMGKHFGFKDGRKTMQRILKACGVEIRSVGFQKADIDPEDLYRLYFGEGWGLNECAEHFQCKSTDPILRVFTEEGWKTRYQETYEKEIDPEEVFRLYDEEGLSLKTIGEHFGVSIGPIRRILKENNMEYSQEIQIDPKSIHRLYFDEGFSKEEVCELLGVSKKPIDRIFKEEGWDKRPVGFQPVEIDLDDFKQLYYEEELELDLIAERLQVSTITVIRFREEHKLEDRVLKYGKELRDEIFGTECRLCGKHYEHVHKKDGKPHKSHILWSRKSLLKLNPDDWAALCMPCHRVSHTLMRAYDFDWNQIEKKVKDILGRMSLREKLKGALSKRF